MNLVSIFTAGTIFFGSLVWLGKIVFEKILDTSIKKFEKELAHRSEIQIESHKHELLLLQQKNNIQFSALHNKRLEIIEKIIKVTIDIRRTLMAIIIDNFKDEESFRKEYYDFLNNVIFFSEYIKSNSHYLKKDTVNRLYTIIDFYDVLIGLLKEVSKKISFEKAILEEDKKQIVETMDDADSKISSVIEDLEDEFRIIIGVEQL